MLVFISDIHLTDGSSGETINPGAFKKFALYLQDIVETANAQEIEIVLLGDIFDVIRSRLWLDTEIRPWSDPAKTDGSNNNLEFYANAIIDGIIKNDRNVKSIAHINDFRNKMSQQGRNVKITYIIGNHDWMINRYPETRVKIAKFLSMDNPEQYKTSAFPLENLWSDYKVFGRHGDIYDSFNYDDNRDASSLGDAIVIDLLNRFPEEVERDIGVNTEPKFIAELKEIDNVRPLLSIPAWVWGACDRAKSGKRAKSIWNKLADDFLQKDFVRAHDKNWQFDLVDFLQIALKLSKAFSVKTIEKYSRKLKIGEKDYEKFAFHEKTMRSNAAHFVIYGHTHGYKVQPLDLIPTSSGNIEKLYLNTGTWRKTHVRTRYDLDNYEFIGWHVMTFIAFYLDSERSNRKFEVWNGVLK